MSYRSLVPLITIPRPSSLALILCRPTKIASILDSMLGAEHIKCRAKKTRECYPRDVQYLWYGSARVTEQSTNSRDYHRYLWALLTGPKDESNNNGGMRYHAKEHIIGPNASTWLFEEKESTLSATSGLLVRVMIAIVKNKDRSISIVRHSPIRQGVAGWNCVR